MTPYHTAIHKCAERYRDMMLEAGIKPHDELWKFNMMLMFGCRDQMPIAKLNRWLGYIQGTLINEVGLTTVQAERDWTRALFRPLDYRETDETLYELRHVVAELRHVYDHLHNERVNKQKMFADGLISPQIRRLEELITKLERGKANEHAAS